MQRKISQQNVITGMAAILIIASLFTIFSLLNSNRGLKKNVGNEKLHSEKLLAEKLSLDKEIAQYNKEIEQFNLDMNNFKGKNDELDLLLTSSQKALSQKQAEINRLEKSNAGNKIIQKELADLKNLKDNYETQITTLNSQLKTLGSGNSSLMEENISLKLKLQALETQNQQLTADIQLVKSMAGDGYLLGGFKGKKDKPTLIARRTNKLILSFDVPDDVNLNLKFKIINPEGQRIEDTINSISSHIVESQESNLTSSVVAGEVKLSKRVQMQYDPKGRFIKGVYKIEIFNNDSYLGSCQVRLK